MHMAGIYMAHGQSHHPSSLPAWVGAEHSWTKPSCSYPIYLTRQHQRMGRHFKMPAIAPDCFWRTITL